MTAPSDVTDRLLSCFSIVFPTLDEEEIRQASQAELDEWDSLASISLVTIIEEEFDLEIDEDSIAKMVTFSAADEILSGLVGAE